MRSIALLFVVCAVVIAAVTLCDVVRPPVARGRAAPAETPPSDIATAVRARRDAVSDASPRVGGSGVLELRFRSRGRPRPGIEVLLIPPGEGGAAGTQWRSWQTDVARWPGRRWVLKQADEAGIVSWPALAPGAYRYAILSDIASDASPPHEWLGPTIREDGRISMRHEMPFKVSGALEVASGKTTRVVEIAGNVVTGVLLPRAFFRAAPYVSLRLREIFTSPKASVTRWRQVWIGAATDAGRFRIEGLPEGTYRLTGRWPEDELDTWCLVGREFTIQSQDFLDLGGIAPLGGTLRCTIVPTTRSGTRVGWPPRPPDGELIVDASPAGDDSPAADYRGQQFFEALPVFLGKPVTIVGLAPGAVEARVVVPGEAPSWRAAAGTSVAPVQSVDTTAFSIPGPPDVTLPLLVEAWRRTRLRLDTGNREDYANLRLGLREITSGDVSVRAVTLTRGVLILDDFRVPLGPFELVALVAVNKGNKRFLAGRVRVDDELLPSGIDLALHPALRGTGTVRCAEGAPFTGSIHLTLEDWGCNLWEAEVREGRFQIDGLLPDASYQGFPPPADLKGHWQGDEYRFSIRLR